MFFKKNRYVPVISTQMKWDQRKYVIDFLMQKKRLLYDEVITAEGVLAKEQMKRFEFTKNTLVIHEENRISQSSFSMAEQIDQMLDKVIHFGLVDEDLPELNKLLDKKQYKMRIAWWRLP
ncbi:hypothetical protein EMIT07CA2_550115 [Brevibacillus sp. IT-7CA2]|uniref:hypothetical protein n=1 Tax=Brevibacillus sp. IT-7CA2 TaxID=3026436 RepID=UPI0039E05426